MKNALLTMKSILPSNEVHIVNNEEHIAKRYGNKPNSVEAETGSATLGAEGRG